MNKQTLAERVQNWLVFAAANEIKLDKILINPNDAQEVSSIKWYGLLIKVLGYSGEE